MFYVNNLDVRQSRQANDSASIVKRAKERFRNRNILKSCTTNKIFVYFRLRYTKQQTAVLNNVVRTRGKIRTLKFSAAFLKACISKRVSPKYTVGRIERSQARHSPEMERTFLTDGVGKLTEQSRKLRTIYQSHWRVAREFPTFFDTIRFCRYLALLDERTESKTSDCLLHSDVTVSAMLPVILQGMF